MHQQLMHTLLSIIFELFCQLLLIGLNCYVVGHKYAKDKREEKNNNKKLTRK